MIYIEYMHRIRCFMKRRGARLHICPYSVKDSGCITAAFNIFRKTYRKAAEDESIHVYK